MMAVVRIGEDLPVRAEIELARLERMADNAASKGDALAAIQCDFVAAAIRKHVPREARPTPEAKEGK